MIKNFPFRLDIKKEYNNRMYSVSSNDLKSVKFTFVVTDNGIPLDLTGLTARIAIRKPDKKAVWQDCTITNAPRGEMEVILDNQAYIKKGEHEAEVMLYKGTNTVAITQKFYYRVTEGIMSDKSLKSETVLGPIDEKLAEVEGTLEDLRKNGTGIDAEARQDIEEVTTQLGETEKAYSSLETANATSVLNMTNYLGNKQNVHGKVLHFPDGWNGFKYWMGYTPYPKGQTSAENPCIGVSSDKENWTVPSGLTNPLDPAPADGYNSDTHLVYRQDLNRLEIWWRYFRSSSYQIIIYRRTSTNGVDWTEKEEIFNFTDSSKEMYSPAVIFENGKYKIWTCRSGFVEYQESQDGTAKTWTTRKQLNIDWDSQNLKAWHLDVEKTDQGYEMIVCAFDKDTGNNNRADLYHVIQKTDSSFTKPRLILGRSKSLNAIDYQSIYRSCFLKIDGIYYIWYSCIDKDNNRWMALSYGRSLLGLNGTNDIKSLMNDSLNVPKFFQVSNTTLTNFDVSNLDVIILSGNVTVNSFAGGYVGKKITLIPYGGTSSVTLVNGSGLLLGGKNLTLTYASEPAIEMVCTNGSGTEWRVQKTISYHNPLETLIELQNHWTGELFYSKNAVNQLCIRGQVTVGTKTVGTPIGNLPLGYRPRNISSVPATLNANPQTSFSGIIVGTSGAILIRPPASDTVNTGDVIQINSIIQL